MAGEIVGSDGKGRDGLLGYLTRIARRDPKTYCGLLGRLLPVDLRSTAKEPEKVFRSIEEEDADLRERLDARLITELAANMAERERARKNGGGWLN